MAYRIFFLSFLLLSGCVVKTVSPQEMTSWVENPDNGLSRKKEVGGFSITAQYRPIDYIISTELKGKPLSTSQYQKRVKELNGMEYYQIRLMAAPDPLLYGGIGQQEYHARNNFMMFGQKDYISLINGNDTIPCSAYHFVNYQGMAPYADLLIGFASPKKITADRELIYDDQLFGFGPLHFTFTRKEIESIPSLELK